jgi:hypothetical protein
VEQRQGLFIDFHILAKRNGCSLSARAEMHPTLGLASGVKFFHDRLMMLKGVHLREIIMTHDLRQPLGPVSHVGAHAGRRARHYIPCRRGAAGKREATLREEPRLAFPLPLFPHTEGRSAVSHGKGKQHA